MKTLFRLATLFLVLPAVGLLSANDCQAQRVITDPSLSQDGRQVIYVAFDSGSRDGNQDLWLMNVDGTNAQRLVQQRAIHKPRFSPDGTKLVFVSQGDLWTINVNVTGLQRLTNTNDLEDEPAFTLDSNGIVFVRGKSGSRGGAVMKMNLANKQEVKMLDKKLGIWSAFPVSSGDFVVQCSCRVINNRLFAGAGVAEVFKVAPDGSAARILVSARSLQTFEDRRNIGGRQKLVKEISRLAVARTGLWVLRFLAEDSHNPGDLIVFTFERNLTLEGAGNLQEISPFKGTNFFFPIDSKSTFDVSGDGSKLVVAAHPSSDAGFELWLYDLVGTSGWSRLTPR